MPAGPIRRWMGERIAVTPSRIRWYATWRTMVKIGMFASLLVYQVRQHRQMLIDAMDREYRQNPKVKW
jgi:hypothetical protein